MKVLVTGATGFIGSILCNQLVAVGHDVDAITRSAEKLLAVNKLLRPIVFDLIHSNYDQLELNDYDIIFNCAGEIKNEALMKSLHLDSLKKMLSRVKGQRTRWVQLSSVGVYGPLSKGIVAEDRIFNPKGEYEVTKAQADELVTQYCNKQQIPFSILRPSNVFGNEMPNQSLLAFISQVKKGRFFYMDNPEKIQTTYVHVDDVVEALMLCGFHQSAINQDFIISDEVSQEVFIRIICDYFKVSYPKLKLPKSFVELIATTFGRFSFFPLTSSRVKALTARTKYSNEKIMKLMGFKFKKGIRFGLLEYFESIR